MTVGAAVTLQRLQQPFASGAPQANRAILTTTDNPPCCDQNRPNRQLGPPAGEVVAMLDARDVGCRRSGGRGAGSVAAPRYRSASGEIHRDSTGCHLAG